MPYIKYTCMSKCHLDWKGNWIGGSEPLIIQMLAKKYRFLPKLIKAGAYDVTELANGTTYGMIHMVRIFNTNRGLIHKISL